MHLQELPRSCLEQALVQDKYCLRIISCGIVLPSPPESCEFYAAALSRIMLNGICTTQLMVNIPLLIGEADGWTSWNALRLLCDQNPRLQVCLELTADLPETDQELMRWLAEPGAVSASGRGSVDVY
ncbi:prmt5 [Symbiodinium natans]|uniref:Prmt5 protein n=1 Tax=Symbiodinium natans TaxID=878477 RepID=A0A812UF86_9DINO|nr:prmt5 [Symbiodinium natans]